MTVFWVLRLHMLLDRAYHSEVGHTFPVVHSIAGFSAVDYTGSVAVVADMGIADVVSAMAFEHRNYHRIYRRRPA
jgi:hypothetical protein